MASYGRRSNSRSSHRSSNLLLEKKVSESSWHSHLVARTTSNVTIRSSKSTRKEQHVDDIYAFPSSDEEAVNTTNKRPKIPALKRNSIYVGERESQKAATEKIRSLFLAPKPAPKSKTIATKSHGLASPITLQAKRKRNADGNDDDEHTQDSAIFDFPQSPEQEQRSPQDARSTKILKKRDSILVEKSSRSTSRARSRTGTPKPGIQRKFMQSSSTPEALTAMISNPSSATLSPLSLAITREHFSPSPSALRRPPSPSPTKSQTPRKLSPLPAEITPRESAPWKKLLQGENTKVQSTVTVTGLPLHSTVKRCNAIVEVSPLKPVQLITSRSKLLPSASDIDNFSTGSDESGNESDIAESDIGEELEVSNIEEQLPVPAKSRWNIKQNHDENNMLTLLLEDSPIRPYSKLRKNALDPDSESEDEHSKPLTVHELKAAGFKKRVVDDLEHLLDGIQDKGSKNLPAQRFELIELAKKLMLPQHLSSLLDHGFDRRFLDSAKILDDVVCDFITTVCLLLIVDDAMNLSILRYIRESTFLDNISQLMTLEDDISKIAAQRNSNMSKVAQSSFLGFRTKIESLSAWSDVGISIVSPQAIAITFMEKLAQKGRAVGTKESILDAASVTKLVSTLEICTNKKDSTSLAIMPLLLSCLELVSAYPVESGLQVWTGPTLEKLVRTLSDLLGIACTVDLPTNVRHSALKLLLNVTNNHTRACNLFATSDLVQSLLFRIIRAFDHLGDEAQDEANMDELILSLGAIINLVEVSNSARLHVINDGGVSLGQLVQILCRKQNSMSESQSMEESTVNIPFGYTALLLVNLCQNETVRKHILGELPVSQLITAAEDFIRIHQKTDREIDGDEGARMHESYTNRLVAMVTILKNFRDGIDW